MALETKQGIVTNLNLKRRFGFIQTEDGRRLFFHETGVISPDFMELKAGLPVEFFEIPDAHNKSLTRAIGVTAR